LQWIAGSVERKYEEKARFEPERWLDASEESLPTPEKPRICRASELFEDAASGYRHSS
jgi:hypothetical protein